MFAFAFTWPGLERHREECYVRPCVKACQRSHLVTVHMKTKALWPGVMTELLQQDGKIRQPDLISSSNWDNHQKKKDCMTDRDKRWLRDIKRQKQRCCVVTWVDCHVALRIQFGSPACDRVIGDALDSARQACRRRKTMVLSFTFSLSRPEKHDSVAWT